MKVFISSRNDTEIVIKLEGSQNVYITASDNFTDIARFVNVELENAIRRGTLLHGNVSVQLHKHIIASLLIGA